jgi:hypothetical protein
MFLHWTLRKMHSPPPKASARTKQKDKASRFGVHRTTLTLSGRLHCKGLQNVSGIPLRNASVCQWPGLTANAEKAPAGGSHEEFVGYRIVAIRVPLVDEGEFVAGVTPGAAARVTLIDPHFPQSALTAAGDGDDLLSCVIACLPLRQGPPCRLAGDCVDGSSNNQYRYLAMREDFRCLAPEHQLS